MYRRPTRSLPVATSIYRIGYSLERAKADELREKGVPTYDKALNTQLKTVVEAMKAGTGDTTEAQFQAMASSDRIKILQALERQSKLGSSEAQQLLPKFEQIHKRIEDTIANFIKDVNVARTAGARTVHSDAGFDLLVKIVKEANQGRDISTEIYNVLQIINLVNDPGYTTALHDLTKKYPEIPSMVTLELRIAAESGTTGAVPVSGGTPTSSPPIDAQLDAIISGWNAGMLLKGTKRRDALAQVVTFINTEYFKTHNTLPDDIIKSLLKFKNDNFPNTPRPYTVTAIDEIMAKISAGPGAGAAPWP